MHTTCTPARAPHEIRLHGRAELDWIAFHVRRASRRAAAEGRPWYVTATLEDGQRVTIAAFDLCGGMSYSAAERTIRIENVRIAETFLTTSVTLDSGYDIRVMVPRTAI